MRDSDVNEDSKLFYTDLTDSWMMSPDKTHPWLANSF
jgi:hypothetical protein